MSFQPEKQGGLHICKSNNADIIVNYPLLSEQCFNFTMNTRNIPKHPHPRKNNNKQTQTHKPKALVVCLSLAHIT